MDAGGKDGCVKHVFSRVDPQGLHVVPFKKPTTEELDHDFLWRVHKEVPAKGQIAIFNRSHYEDIIAVRVKKSSRTQSGNAATSMSSTLNPCLRKKEPSSSSYS